MDGRELEPRKALWAVAEVSWQDQAGRPSRAPATMEDTSRSGACLRLKAPIQIGSRITVKWHREQFSAVAKNCRSVGKEFLLGVRREPSPSSVEAAHGPKRPATSPTVGCPVTVQAEAVNPAVIPAKIPPAASVAQPAFAPPAKLALSTRTDAVGETGLGQSPTHTQFSRTPTTVSRSSTHATQFILSSPLSAEGSSPRPERNVMQPKGLFPKFWRRQSDEDAPKKDSSSEVPVNQPNSHATDAASVTRGELLSYEDIYNAAGILNPPSGYGIPKVVEMLNSERIRDLSKDIKRASVLMALDAAGTSVDDLLQDATRRQRALDSYEASQRKQLEEFEARKSQENARIESEMERLRAHYAERVQRNLEQVERERDALRNWQMARQHESQRISEVIELCRKQPAAASAAAAASSPGSRNTNSASVAEPAATTRPTPLNGE